jgi:hypothetical protein
MVKRRRAGRRAKSGPRYPCGKRRESDDLDGGRPPIWVRRIFDNAEALGLDPRIATQVGRLHILRALTETQVAAADLIARIYGRYEYFHGLRRSVRSPSYEIGMRRAEWAEDRPEETARARDAFLRLQDCFPAAPAALRAAVEQLAVEDRAVSPVHLDGVRAALDRIAGVFGLAPAPAKARRRQGAAESRR